MTARLVLASGSPRRHQLLGKLGVRFDVVGPQVDEHPLDGELPAHYALRTAGDKGDEVVGRLAPGRAWVLAADTVVSIDGRILGKPADLSDARSMLRSLSGRVHSVFTGTVLIDSESRTKIEGLDETRVRFRQLASSEIEAYVSRESVMDKAGAYGIQGAASEFVPEIRGNYSNVVGLSLPITFGLLRKAGLVCGARGS